MSVGWFDAVIRTCYGVYEFTDDPSCVLRAGLSPARATISLSDGTRIEMGQMVGTLLFWNEHLPHYTIRGPDLRWACLVRNQLLHSLQALTLQVESEPAWRHIRALRGEAALSTRLRMAQVRRVAERFGFERVPMDSSLLSRLHALGESFTLWGLTRRSTPLRCRDSHSFGITMSCGFPEPRFSSATLTARDGSRASRSNAAEHEPPHRSQPLTAPVITGPNSTHRSPSKRAICICLIG